MAVVRLGKLYLHWCDNCNLPILEEECGLCGNKTRKVQITPPGDVRPAFSADLDLIGKAIDVQFGEGCCNPILPKDKVILLNKAPGIDRADEVIVDGMVIGTLRYNIRTGYQFLMRMEGARLIQKQISRGWIVVDDGAIDSISKGASAMAVGVLDADKDIRAGDEVLTLTTKREAIAVGIARMNGTEMMGRRRGPATKTRWSAPASSASTLRGGQTWDDVLKANERAISRIVNSSISFIQKVVADNHLPIAVSFSGGKDSLATLLLTMDAGLLPFVLFVDTGLEFPETIEHVMTTAKMFGLPLIQEDAHDSFWKNLEQFGPPGKDFRWCCKTCKLGPTARLIRKNFPNGVVSFIGQRRYESERRAAKGSVWENPWVPNQKAASPIQDWTALHVWLYITRKGLEFNPWYERGLSRIGCWLCPSSDLAELKIIEQYFAGYSQWQKFLSDHAAGEGWSQEWVELGLWRWKCIPRELRALAIRQERKRPKEDLLKFHSSLGYIPCTSGLSLEGMFNHKLTAARIRSMLNILGRVEWDEEAGACKSSNVTLFEEGAVIIRGRDEEEITRVARKLERIVQKAENCVGCGICEGLCSEGAISLEDQAWIDEEKCIHCGSCLAPCPAADFKGEFTY